MQWLDYLKISEKYRQKTIMIDNKKYRVDAFDHNTNTIYEFYGDYWHGNNSRYKSDQINYNNKCTFGELYQRTIERENLIKQAGYTVISIWENDFRKMLKQEKLNKQQEL